MFPYSFIVFFNLFSEDANIPFEISFYNLIFLLKEI